MKHSLLAFLIITAIFIPIISSPATFSEETYWWKSQLYEYLVKIFGLQIPSDFFIKIQSYSYSDHSCLYYKVLISYNNVSFRAGFCIGRGMKIISIDLECSYGELNRLNWTKRYLIPSIIYDEQKYIVNITDKSKFIASILSILEDTLEIDIVKKHLDSLVGNLCYENYSGKPIYLEWNNETIELCPGCTVGTDIQICEGKELEYDFSVRDKVLRIFAGLGIKLVKDAMSYKVLGLGLSRLENNQYVLTSFMWKPYHILVSSPQDSLEDLKTIAFNYVNESLDKIVAENIDESSCKIEITSTRTYYFYKEKYLNETTILVEYPLICAVRVKCTYNSTAYWVREIYLYISPSTEQIIYAEIHDPYIEFKDIKKD